MSIAIFGTKSRGMVLGRGVTVGQGHHQSNPHDCPRCKHKRMSAIHKARCKYNPSPVWS